MGFGCHIPRGHFFHAYFLIDVRGPRAEGNNSHLMFFAFVFQQQSPIIVIQIGFKYIKCYNMLKFTSLRAREER